MEPSAQSLAAHAGLIPGETAMEERWRREMFGKVRILVAGRSGSGKSTLLRLIIGAEGPQTVAGNGTAGQQDIDEGFQYRSEQGIPLIFHDSNGIGTMEGQNLKRIEEFLKKRQSDEDFSQQVHVIWYVASAVDNRMKDDGGLLTLLCSFDIPMLLVLTHSDVASARMSERSMHILHSLIDDSTRAATGFRVRTALKETIIAIGNDVEFMEADHQIRIHQLDVQGLKNLSDWTGRLLKSEEMKATWVASQASYTDLKLGLSAQWLAHLASRAVLSAPTAVVPFTDAIRKSLLFKEVFSTMVTIWGVPKVLEEVLHEKLFRRQHMDTLCRSLMSDVTMLGGAVVAVVGAAATGGASLLALIPAVASGVGALGESRLVNANSAPILVKAFALQIVAYILYVRCRQESSKHRWDPQLTTSQCEALCDEVFANAGLTTEIKEFAKSTHSTLDTVFRKETVQIILKARMDKISNDILVDRPSSFASLSGFGGN